MRGHVIFAVVKCGYSIFKKRSLYPEGIQGLEGFIHNIPMLNLLKTHFGYDAFRPLQEDIIHSVLSGQDCLVLMPTGGGKSLCYQLPAMKFDGITVVISPLIALMKDQVDGLTENGIPAAYMNSSMSSAEIAAVAKRAQSGELKILYVAPERLAIPSFREFLRGLRVRLIAIDEAHCISEWGHDFRPDYRNLKNLRADFSGVPVIALTATATEQVRQDIIDQLALSSAQMFRSSFDRPNVSYYVRPKQRAFDALCVLLKKNNGEPVIIYCFSRKNTEALAADLAAEGFSAAAYHAGLLPEERRTVQEKFIRDEVSIITATIAFGMGIDKPDIRLIVHYDLPKTVEGYYQETGRAGRDGLPAECVLFFSAGDIRKHQFFIDQIEDADERRHTQDKLARVVEFCEGTACRRAYLLQYFSEAPSTGNCGSCDNCLSPRETFDATEIAQKIVSAVLKTGERFGGNYVVEVLKGSRSEAIRERGHERLTVFGIVGREFDKNQLRNIVRQLMSRGILEKSDAEFPTLSVTDYGKRWLVERASLTLAQPPRRESEISAGAPESAIEFDRDLFERLRALRKRLADERGVPPFVIFGNNSLMEMARRFPQSEESFLAVSGVGKEKLARFGEAFISEIKSYASGKGIAEHAHSKKYAPLSERSIARAGSTYDETVRLIEQGLSIEETAKRRGIAPGTVVSHLEKLAHSGRALNIDHVQLSEDRFAKISHAFVKTGEESLTPAKELLGEDFSYDELRLARLFLRRVL